MNLWFDFKYAMRLQLKSPLQSLLCVVVVAISIGLAVISYSFAYRYAYQPLPFPGAERWYSVQIAPDSEALAEPFVEGFATLDAFTYQELNNRNRAVHHLGAYTNQPAVLSEGQASAGLRAATISPTLLSAMQVKPHLGRVFSAEDREPGAAPVVILSFDTWQNYFAADPTIVGKSARIASRAVQVIGVMPKDFYAFWDFELWMPMLSKTLAVPSNSAKSISAFIYLDKGQDAGEQLREMQATVDDVNHRYPQIFKSGRHLELVPAHRIGSNSGLPAIAMFNVIAVAVMLIGCLNISLVFLAQLLERGRELALRTALGSSRWRLLRQCLLESGFVVLLGLLLGYSIGAMGVRLAQDQMTLVTQLAAMGRPPYEVVLQPGGFITAVIVATFIWLLSTLVPAWRITKQDAAVVLAGSGKGIASVGSGKSASILVSLQIVVSCVVLVVCANMAFSLKVESSRPTGLSTAGVMSSLSPTVFSARYSAAAERLRYWDELTAAIKGRIAGAEAVYATAPPAAPARVSALIESNDGAGSTSTARSILKLPIAAVSENYFDLLGIQLRAGRLFDSTDNSSSLAVAIVDESTAERHWPNQSPLGKRIKLNSTGDGRWLTIVGVVSHVRTTYDQDVGVVYESVRQATPAYFHLLVRVPTRASTSNEQDSRMALRAAAFAVDRDLPLRNLQMIDEIGAAVAAARDNAMVTIIGAMAAITAFLTATGLFGLISRMVAQRTQEVGVRYALGATQWQVTVALLRPSALYLIVASTGIAAGLLVTNLLSSGGLFTNILDHAALVTSEIFALIVFVILAASYLPTRRAVALEPGDALRYE